MIIQPLVSRLTNLAANTFTLLIRTVLGVITLFVSAVLFAWKNDDRSDDDAVSGIPKNNETIVGQDEAEQYGWDSW